MSASFRNLVAVGAVVLGLLWGVCAASAGEPEARLIVNADQPGVTVSPMLYGIFFEEINRAGEGGLYAEMLQNRSFEDAKAPIGWTLLKGRDDDASMVLDTGKPLNANNPTCLKLTVSKASGRVGICNQGFKGVRYGRNDEPTRLYERFKKAAAAQTCGLRVEQGKDYRLSLYVRGENVTGPLTAATIKEQKGRSRLCLKVKRSMEVGNEWKKVEAKLTAKATDSNARLVIAASTPGVYYFDMVSLFPAETFKDHPNGMRKDLAQLVADMHPAFVRFPGGCQPSGRQHFTKASLEESDRRRSPATPAGTSICGATIQATAWAITNTSSSARTSGPNPCSFSTAAWPTRIMSP